jgi:hypothetical protein
VAVDVAVDEKVDPVTTAAAATTVSVEGILLAVSAVANILLGVPYLRSLVNKVN